MKVLRGQQIEKACGQMNRYRMDCLFVKRNVKAVGGRSVLCGTDGRQITALVVELEAEEVEGLIPPAAVILSRSVDGRVLSLPHGIVVMKGKSIVATFARPEGEFPTFDVPTIFPERPEGRAPIHVNSDYLAKMGDAIGARLVRIWPSGDASAMRVELHGQWTEFGEVNALCAIMPISEDEPK